MNLLQAKLVLYSNLLSVPVEKMTDSDTDILFALSKDSEVQAHLDKKVDTK